MEDEFKNRFAKYEDELRYLYLYVYHGDVKAYDYFISMLYKAWQSRSEKLKDIDRAREIADDWYKGNTLVGMLMYADSFAKNLRGVEKHLDYIESCKVNYLHLMPLLDSPEGRSDGGYAVRDFRKVRSDLGTMEDLAFLCDSCHQRGISVCLDFVMNHTSEEHEWAKKARAGDREYQNRYFFYDDWNIPNEFEKTVPQVFPISAPGNFTWLDDVKKVVMTTFYPYQWDLNYANPVVFNDMVDNMLNLCNHGVDVIRLDAVPYIWKQLGTSCRNLPEVHTLVRIMRLACDIVAPCTLLLGEVVMEPSKVVPYFGPVEKPECHLLYNVTTMATIWHTVATADTKLLRHQLEQVFALPKSYTFLNYLRCHDDIGWGLDYQYLALFGQKEAEHKKFLNDYFTGRWPGSVSRGELYNDDPRLKDARLCGTTASLCGVEWARVSENEDLMKKAIDKDVMLHAFMLSLSGVPVFYSGDEIGMENDYSYHGDPLKADDSRYLHRGKFDWDKAEKRFASKTIQARIFSRIMEMQDARSKNRAFDSQADCWLLELKDDGLVGIGRFFKGQKAYCLFNFSDIDKTIRISDLAEYRDIIGNKSFATGEVPVFANGFRWLEAKA